MCVLKQKDWILKNMSPLQIPIFHLDTILKGTRFRLSRTRNFDFLIHYWPLDSSCYLQIHIPLFTSYCPLMYDRLNPSTLGFFTSSISLKKRSVTKVRTVTLSIKFKFRFSCKCAAMIIDV